MDLARFLELTGRLDADQLRMVADALGDHRAAPADTVEWWQAVLTAERAHRAAHSRRAGSMASRRACASVLAAARRGGLSQHSDEVVATARAAGTVAWALAAGPQGSEAAAALLEPWREALDHAVA